MVWVYYSILTLKIIIKQYRFAVMTKGKICFFELCFLHYWTIRAPSIATVYRVCLGKSPSTLYENHRKREHNPLASPSQFDGSFSTPSLRGTFTRYPDIFTGPGFHMLPFDL